MATFPGSDQRQHFSTRTHARAFTQTYTPGDVVDEEGAGGAAVVAPGYGAEALLAGRVPDLQLDRLAAAVDHL